MKKAIITTALVLVLVLVAPLTHVITEFATQPRSDETYYGQLSRMYPRLQDTDGKKIVHVGHSAVASGVRCDLTDYEATRSSALKCGLSESRGTIPQPTGRARSREGSAGHAWGGMDGDVVMVSDIAAANAAEMPGNWVGSVGEKCG